MVAHIFQNGDKAYIIDNVRFLREVIVLKETEKEAIDRLPPDAHPKKRNHWDYEMYH